MKEILERVKSPPFMQNSNRRRTHILIFPDLFLLIEDGVAQSV